MLSFSPSECVWAVLGFVVLMIVLNRILFKPVYANMEKRKQKVAAQLAAGVQLEQRMDAFRADLALSLEQKYKEAAANFATASAAAEAQKEKVLETELAQLAQEEEVARAALQMQQQRVAAQTQTAVGPLAAQMLSRLLDQPEESLLSELKPEVLTRISQVRGLPEKLGRRLFLRIISPEPLSAEQINLFAQRASEKFAVAVHAINDINPEIGEIRLVVGEIIYDQTLRRKLGRANSLVQLFH